MNNKLQTICRYGFTVSIKKYMKNIFSYFFTIIIISSCAESENKTAADISSKDHEPAAMQLFDVTGCYRMVIEKDSALLHLESKGIFVAGTLYYKPFEKDKSTGTIKGTVEKDMVKAWYTFQSEGSISVKEVCFKKTGDAFAEAYGDVGLRHDSVYFKYPGTLKYEDRHLYNKIVCE